MLKRKLWRDIKDNYGAYLAVISVIAIGLILFVSLSIILDVLEESKENYYAVANFADGYAQVVSAPYNVVKDIENIPGINSATGRIVKDILVNKPKGEEITTIRIISFVPNQKVNKFTLEQGRIPRDGEKQILLSPAFLKANNLKLGDEIPLIIAGKEVKFTITGTALSPEFIYEIPNGQTMTPNPKTFGVAYAPHSTIAPLFNMEGQVNDAVFTLEKGKEFSEVKSTVTRLLDNYGLTQLYPRKDQLSHSMLTQELVGLKGSATTTPVIFLLVAASILYIMLKRMVEHQRGQIGILKAFGFSNIEIMTHYLGYAILIGFLGGLVGSLGGGALSYSLATLYQQYFNIPGLSGRFSIYYIAVGTLLSVLFSIVAGIQGAKQVLRLSPSEAMRPAMPTSSGKTLIERVRLLWNFLNTQGKMAVRNLFRSKQRTFLAVFGISASFSMMVAAGASFDATDYLVAFQFDTVEKYDIKIGLNRFTDINEAVTGSKYLNGVLEAEPLLEVPVTINNKWLKKDIAITGLKQNSTLFNLTTDQGEKVKLPSHGIVISSQLAKTLNINLGDKVTIKPFLGDKKEKMLVVEKIIPQYVGVGAYMDIQALSILLEQPPVTSSILLKVDKHLLPDITKELQEAQNVSGIYDKTKMKLQFQELMEQSKSTQFILLFFAFLTGFAIVYNVTIISLSERERELATLLILGMTEREVGSILVYEQGILGLMGIVIGIPLSYGMLYAIANASGSELYNIPIIISLSSLMTGIIGTLLFLFTSQWRVNSKLGKLSMLEVLKEQE